MAEDKKPCLLCGKCCQYITLMFPMGIDDKEYARLWLEYHGVKIVKESESAVMALQVPAKCQYLKEDGSCSIYTDPNRPQICADFPVGKDPVCPQNTKNYVDKTRIEPQV